MNLKTKFAVFIAMFCLLSNANGQNTKPTFGTFSFTFGPSRPIGKITSTDYQNPKAGFMNGGGAVINFALNMDWKEKYALGLRLTGNSFAANNFYLIDQDLFAVIGQKPYFGGYSSLSLKMSILRKHFLHNSQKSYWFYRGEIGGELNRSPYDVGYDPYIGTSQTPIPRPRISTVKATHFSPILSLGIGFSTRFSKNFGFMTSLDYAVSNFGTEHVKYDDPITNQVIREYDKSFGIVNRFSLDFGLFIQFYKRK